MGQVLVMIKLDFENHLCKHIRRIIFGENFLQLNITIFKNISYEGVSNINVLRSRMVDLIFARKDNTHTITIDF